MSWGSIWYLLVAAVLAFVAYRGFRTGRLAFTHDDSLANDRRKNPGWFWAQFALILTVIAVLVWAAVS